MTRKNRICLGTATMDSNNPDFKLKLNFDGYFLAKDNKDIQDFYMALHKFIEEQEKIYHDKMQNL